MLKLYKILAYTKRFIITLTIVISIKAFPLAHLRDEPERKFWALGRAGKHELGRAVIN